MFKFRGKGKGLQEIRIYLLGFFVMVGWFMLTSIGNALTSCWR
ncbi:hypothetical protein [Sinanaerobacter chloroacetimidivorans]|nr:hypothetical protein [Sinanaerobacter chloroacetimidivorans]